MGVGIKGNEMMTIDKINVATNVTQNDIVKVRVADKINATTNIIQNDIGFLLERFANPSTSMDRVPDIKNMSMIYGRSSWKWSVVELGSSEELRLRNVTSFGSIL